MASTRQSTGTAPAGEVISSRENQWLKEFRLALRGGLATSRGSIGAEGVRLVEEALRSGLHVEALLVSASGERHLERLQSCLQQRREGPIRILRTTDRLFAGVADTETPQGIAALVTPRVASFDDIVRSPAAGSAMIVVLVGVQDPGNVGTILRTCEAFGASGVATCVSGASGTANPYSPKALRASAGSALRLSVLHGVGISILLAQLRVAGLRVLAACSRGHESCAPSVFSPWEINWKDPVALLIGNEGAGLPEEIERSADALVRIPLAEHVESLNAAAAAAVLLYEAARQRRAL
ncbi:MAG TPA: RNA methyltransferase [Candidatus Acidoferrales bacterium]|nr:RNA methyltransferase [Candidatus Acidoferrales bacterium]